MKLVLATANKHKVVEIEHILSGLDVELLSMRDLPDVPDVVEDGDTFEENSSKKAIAFTHRFGMPSLADDSGLEIAVLDGKPGIHSARFAGPNSTKEKLCRKVLRLMKDVPPAGRKARFICCIAIADVKGRVRFAEGIVHGSISDEMRGENGFGYDQIFIPKGQKLTFAQMDPSKKNRLSHRALALKIARKVIAVMARKHAGRRTNVGKTR